MASGVAFTIGRIPVRIQPVFFVVIVVLGLFNAWQYILTWVVIATLSVLLHELGHAVAFRRFGLEPSITLHAVGGLTSASGEASDKAFSPVRGIITSLAGPVAALVLFGLPALWFAQRSGFDPWIELRPFRRVASPAEIILGQIVYINVGWSLLNLIPVLPLDGGNVTASVFELVAPRRGRRIANVLSIALACGLALWGYQHVGPVAPVFALIFVGLNVSELTRSRQDDDDDALGQAVRALVAYQPAQAEELARSVLARSPSGERLGWAIELTAWARLAAGDQAGAQHFLITMPPGAGPSPSVRGALALAGGRVAEGVSTLAWAFIHDPNRSARALGAIAAAQGRQAAAVAHELVLMGPEGIEAAQRLNTLLASTGHSVEAEEVARAIALAAPRPPGW